MTTALRSTRAVSEALAGRGVGAGTGVVGRVIGLAEGVCGSCSPSRSATRSLAGFVVGIFLIVLDQTPADSGLVPLVANRAVDALITWSVIGLLALRGISRASSRRGVLLAVASGLLDASANTLILVGLRAGDLSTMSVLV